MRVNKSMNLKLNNFLICILVLSLGIIFVVIFFIASGPILFSPISTVPVIGGSSWEKKWGGTFADESISIGISENGDTYLAGNFISFADLNPDWGVNMHTHRGTGFYISKFTTDGVYDWTSICDLRHITTTSTYVILGADNRIYVGNECSLIKIFNLDGEPIQDSPINAIVGSPVDFDDGGNLFVTNDALLKKVNNEGNELWEFQHVNGPNTITLDSYGSVFLASDHLVKLDPDGNEIWSVEINGWATGIDDNDSDFIYVTGGSYSGKNINIDLFIRTAGRRGSDTSFLAKYDLDGNLIWFKEWNSKAYDIAVAGSGDVYVTGEFSYPVDFDPGPAEVIRNNHGDRTSTVFLSKFNSDGIFEWVRVGREPASHGNCIILDKSGNIILGGMTRGDAFLAKFTPDGGSLRTGY
jgi:hypothetical protein